MACLMAPLACTSTSTSREHRRALARQRPPLHTNTYACTHTRTHASAVPRPIPWPRTHLPAPPGSTTPQRRRRPAATPCCWTAATCPSPPPPPTTTSSSPSRARSGPSTCCRTRTAPGPASRCVLGLPSVGGWVEGDSPRGGGEGGNGNLQVGRGEGGRREKAAGGGRGIMSPRHSGASGARTSVQAEEMGGNTAVHAQGVGG